MKNQHRDPLGRGGQRSGPRGRSAPLEGVILAAGRGTRLRELGVNYPKSILPIGNRPIIEYQIELLKSIGVKRILVVLGHLGHEITKVLGDGSRFGVRIDYQPQTEALGIAHALFQLEPLIHGPFVLFLGDTYFEVREPQRLVDTWRRSGAAGVLAATEKGDPEEIKKNFSIRLDADGLVRRVIEKPRYIENRLKGCGLYLFEQVIFDAIRRTPRTAMRDEYELTEAIQIMIDDGFPVRVAPVVEWDVNVTFGDDLLEGNLHWLREHRGGRSLIGKRVRRPKDCLIEGCVIGDRVVIEQPCVLRDCVVLADSRVSGKRTLRRRLITPLED